MATSKNNDGSKRSRRRTTATAIAPATCTCTATCTPTQWWPRLPSSLGCFTPFEQIVTRWQTAPRDEVETKLAQLATRLLIFHPDPARKHEHQIAMAIGSAFRGADVGNPAVGAILLDPAGELLWVSPPSNLKPHFRSDLHAEMALLDGFEDNRHFKNQSEVEAAMFGSSLFTSLEACMMCGHRLIMSGVTNVFHAADDTEGGIMPLLGKLPPVWEKLRKGKVFAKADCSDELQSIAFEAFLITITASGRTDLWPDAVKPE